VEDFGEGRPWCNLIDCCSGSCNMMMHLST
jgi:hypothetical protein